MPIEKNGAVKKALTGNAPSEVGQGVVLFRFYSAAAAAVTAGNDKNSKNYEPDEIVAVKKIAKASHSIISFSF